MQLSTVRQYFSFISSADVNKTEIADYTPQVDGDLEHVLHVKLSLFETQI